MQKPYSGFSQFPHATNRWANEFRSRVPKGTDCAIPSPCSLRLCGTHPVSVPTRVPPAASSTSAWFPRSTATRGSLAAVQKLLDEAAAQRADTVLLPQECILTPGEPIPGPLSNSIAEKARQHKMYIAASFRERDGGKIYVTSFLWTAQAS